MESHVGPSEMAMRTSYSEIEMGEKEESSPTEKGEKVNAVVQKQLWLNSIMNCEDFGLATNRSVIQKVPKRLRNIQSNQGCFDPRVVSIGPYHHGKPELQHMEKFKKSFTKTFVESSKSKSADLLFKEVEKLLDKVKNCYVKGRWMKKFGDDEYFSKMMFLDGCFILQFMDSYPKKDKLLETGMKAHEIAFVQRDLFLLENQLPFEVLEALINMRYGKGEEGLSMMNVFIKSIRGLPLNEESWMDFCINAADNLIRCKWFKKKQPSPKPKLPEQRPAYLLDLLWTTLIDINALKPEPEENNKGGHERNSGWPTFHAARELQTAGIEFRRSKSHQFTDVSCEHWLHKGILRVPPIIIDDSTKSLLLNLVAYEMCPSGPKEFGVTSYICFMNSLIDHPEDVKELRRKGILLNFLGSDEQVAELFNNIANDLVPNPYAYERAKKKIQSHCNNLVKFWLNEFNTHFSSPWSFLAFIVASIGIVLTFIQTYHAIYGKKEY